MPKPLSRIQFVTAPLMTPPAPAYAAKPARRNQSPVPEAGVVPNLRNPVATFPHESGLT